MKEVSQKIKNILIKLTDITGFDHSPTALEAFAQAESDIQSEIDLAVAEERSRIVEIIEKYELSYEEKDLDVIEKTVLGQVIYDILSLVTNKNDINQ